MEIRSNYHWREFVYGWQLPEKWREEYDYMDEDEFDSTPFAYYKGWAHPLDDFMRNNNEELAYWDGLHADTYFSGTVIKISTDGDQYQIGYVFC